jgi:hypothetical protein
VQIASKHLVINRLRAIHDAWHVVCIEVVRRRILPHKSFMKTYAIHWKSSVTGAIGTGTKRFEKEEAEHLAEELNENYPEINHKAVIPALSATTPTAEPAAFNPA